MSDTKGPQNQPIQPFRLDPLHNRSGSDNLTHVKRGKRSVLKKLIDFILGPPAPSHWDEYMEHKRRQAAEVAPTYDRLRQQLIRDQAEREAGDQAKAAE